MTTTYDVTLRMTGSVQDFTYTFTSESQARSRFYELAHRDSKVSLVEVVLEKTTHEELDRWRAPGHPF